MKSSIRIYVYIVLISAVAAYTSVQADHAQTLPPTTLQHPSDNWMLETWNGSEKPYSDARARITQEVSESSNPAGIVFRYKALSVVQPWNALAAFCWAVAADAALHDCYDNKKSGAYLDGVAAALAAAASPHVYEYARMRFYFGSYENWTNPDFLILGNRLLQVDPNDAQVLAGMAFCDPDFQKSLAFIHKAINLDPTYPSRYFTLGLICVDKYMATGGKPEYGRQTIAAFDKFVQLSPGKSDTRDMALNLISDTKAALRLPYPPKPLGAQPK